VPFLSITQEKCLCQKFKIGAGHQWLSPVILATQEAEIRKIVVQSQPREIIGETLSRKNTKQKRADGVAQGVSPEFKPQYWEKKKKNGEKKKRSWVLVAHACNPSESEGRDQKDRDS
jgi:hypothetical protein